MKFLISAIVVLTSCAAQAQTAPQPEPTSPVQSEHWRMLFSPYSIHYSHNSEHRTVWMIGLEKQRTDTYVWGGSFFSNSFGQESGYVYGGQRWDHVKGIDPLFVQWTAGVLYGYKKPYENKVPFNYHGFSPGLVLSVGWQLSERTCAQLNILGNSALMFQVSLDLR
jgi:opacity protein-like surface antigen